MRLIRPFTFSSLWLVSAIAGCEKGEVPAEPSSNPTRTPAVESQSDSLSSTGDEKQSLTTSPSRYDKRTLDEWRKRIKGIDPSSPESIESIDGLIALTRDRNVPDATRRQAAELLGRMGAKAKQAVPVLIELLDEPTRQDASPPFWAAKALGHFGPDAQTATPKLIRILHDPGQRLAHREVAVETLAFIGTAHPSVVPTLIALLKTNTPSQKHPVIEIALFRQHAADSLAVIGPNASVAVPALIRATRDDHENVRHSAVVALGAMRQNSEIAIPALVDSLLSDESPSVRDAAALALGEVGPAAIETLVQLLADDLPEVRRRAAAALGSMKRLAQPAADALLKTLDDENAVVRITAAEAFWAVTADPQPILPSLVQGLTEKDRQVRMRSLRQLTTIGNRAKPALAALEKLLSDERPYVRSIAAKAIKKIESAAVRRSVPAAAGIGESN